MMIIADGEKSYNCSEDSRFPSADNYLYFPDNIVNCSEGTEMTRTKIPKIPTLCACGCGEVVWNGKIFRSGHNSARNQNSRGLVPWNKGVRIIGIPHSEETKRKISKANLGKGNPMYGKTAWKGRTHTSESKIKMSLAKRGNTYNKRTRIKKKCLCCGKEYETIPSHLHRSFFCSRSCTAKYRLTGLYRSEEIRRKISSSRQGITPWNKGISLGKKAHNWKGGKKLKWARIRARRRSIGFKLITKNNPYNELIEYHHIHPNLPYVVPCPTRIHKMFPGASKYHFNNVNAMLGFKYGV